MFIKMSTIEIQNRYTFEDSKLKGNTMFCKFLTLIF